MEEMREMKQVTDLKETREIKKNDGIYGNKTYQNSVELAETKNRIK